MKYYVVPTFTVGAAFIIWIFITQFNWHRNCKAISKELENNDILRKANKKCTTWFSMSVLWLAIEYLGVIIPFEASCIVLYIGAFDQVDKKPIIIYSIVSMVMVVAVYAINPHKHVQGYRRAYVRMDYYINKEIAKADMLIYALRKGERDINDAFDIE